MKNVVQLPNTNLPETNFLFNNPELPCNVWGKNPQEYVFEEEKEFQIAKVNDFHEKIYALHLGLFKKNVNFHRYKISEYSEISEKF